MMVTMIGRPHHPSFSSTRIAEQGDRLAGAKGDDIAAASFFVPSLVGMFVGGLGVLVSVLAVFVSRLGVLLRLLVLTKIMMMGGLMMMVGGSVMMSGGLMMMLACRMLRVFCQGAFLPNQLVNLEAGWN